MKLAPAPGCLSFYYSYVTLRLKANLNQYWLAAYQARQTSETQCAANGYVP